MLYGFFQVECWIFICFSNFKLYIWEKKEFTFQGSYLRVTAIAETTAASTRPHATRDEVTTTPDATPRRLPIFGTGSGRTGTPESPDVRDSPDTTAHPRTGGTNRPY